MKNPFIPLHARWEGLRSSITLPVVMVLLALLLSACGGGGGGGGGDGTPANLLPENPFAYSARGCGNTENGVIYQRNIAGSSPSTTQTYVIRDIEGRSYYARATSRGSLYSAPRPDNSSERLLGQILGLLLPIPLPSPGDPLPAATPVAQGSAFLISSDHRLDRTNPNPLTVRVFTQNGRQYFAADTGQTCGANDTNLTTPTIFAFPANRFAVPSNVTVFALNDESQGFRGFMSGKGVKIGGFRFLADDSFRHLHMEHQADLYQSEDGGFSILADSGYKRWDAGMHSAIYGKLTAKHKWSEDTSLYLQSAIGDLESDFYANSLLHGFSAGVFADKVVRHNDYWHVRIEQPFSSPAAARWQVAADLRIGEEKDYYGLGVSRLIDDNHGELAVFYHREL